ncbi:unnamed protein product, partial [Rangifer tarandus platyrhynchus]
PEGPQTGHLPEDSPQAGWDPQDRGAPTGRQSCWVTPCLHKLWAPLSPSLCSQEPRTGKGGPSPTSLCSWVWTRGAPCCLWGAGGQSWVLQREMRKPPVGIFKENTLEQQFLDPCTRWPHSAPQPPCK